MNFFLNDFFIQHQDKLSGTGEYISEWFIFLPPDGTKGRWPSVIGCKYQAKMATIREILAGFFHYLKQTCGRRRVLSVLNQ